MQTEDNRLADYVRSPLSPVQKQELLERVLDGRTRRTSPGAILSTVAAGATVAALAFLWISPLETSEDSPTISAESDHSKWYATGDERLAVMLPAARRIELQEWTQLNMLDAEGHRARLERGTVRCEGGDAPLTIEAANAEIYYEGEPLTVEMGLNDSGPVLTVRALSGAVKLRHEGMEQTVLPGQSWSTRDDVSPVPKPIAPTSPKKEAEKLVPKLTASQSSAQELWRQAQEARLSGAADEAARLFGKLKTEFPNDSRAGLAAFELGRIRLDRQGDPAAALQAFNFAIRRGRGGYFVADAAAGQVTALDRMGDALACKRAREAFLKQYPGSPHAGRVRDLCD